MKNDRFWFVLVLETKLSLRLSRHTCVSSCLFFFFFPFCVFVAGSGGRSPETNLRTYQASVALTLTTRSTSSQAATRLDTQTRRVSVEGNKILRPEGISMIFTSLTCFISSASGSVEMEAGRTSCCTICPTLKKDTE